MTNLFQRYLNFLVLVMHLLLATRNHLSCLCSCPVLDLCLQPTSHQVKLGHPGQLHHARLPCLGCQAECLLLGSRPQHLLAKMTSCCCHFLDTPPSMCLQLSH